MDGGAAANNLLMQLQADLLGVRVVRPTVLETTALGAAYLAGLAVGFWKNKRAIELQWKSDAKFTPSMKTAERDMKMQRWERARTMQSVGSIACRKTLLGSFTHDRHFLHEV